MYEAIFFDCSNNQFFHGCCAAKNKLQPYRIPQEQFHSQIKRVAIFPLTFNHDFGSIDYNEVRKNIETGIAAEMERANIQTIPSDKIEELAKEIEQQEKGMFNSRTGEIDEAQFEKLSMLIYEKISERFETDAILYSTIFVVSAKYSAGSAYFCGARQRASSAGKMALEMFLTGPGHGQIPASCLAITMSDMNDKTIYEHAGGIEILAKVKLGKIEPILPEKLFLDEERINEAINIALSPITCFYK